MSCNCFEDTLLYSSPSHGDWGVVRIAALVPESHILFICPFACGRHGALGAVQHGFKDRVSYLYVDQRDIIAGYDDLVEQAVGTLLSKKPCMAILLFVSCLDDLIGTDLEALCERLHPRHPGTAFRSAHMNPIALDTKEPPMLTTNRAMFDFLMPRSDRDRGINLVGNLDPIRPDCELFGVLRMMGAAPTRHIGDFDTFETFQDMAKSAGSLVLSPIGTLAAQSMERKLAMPYLFEPVSYRLSEIAEQYMRIARFLGKKCAPDLENRERQARDAMEETRRALGGRPVWIAGGAVAKPFGLARALLEAGFRVETVVAQKVLPIDRTDYDWMRKTRPEIAILQPQHTRLIDFGCRRPEAVAVGFDAAYIAGTGRVLELANDAGLFGYGGIVRLMEGLTAAASGERDLKELIDAYGAVV